jgi:tRNA dimethylallyltransferase
MPDRPAPVYVCGPTAAGKSVCALDLANQLDGEIVNADACQLYQGVGILTAAPGPDDRTRARHHLFGVLDPAEPIDAFRFRELALPVLAEISGRGKTPVVVGGSGLYLKFLTHGPAVLPPADLELRRKLDSRPLDDLLAELRALDPAEAARIDPANRRYVARALEICLLTGRPASQLRDQWQTTTARVQPTLRGVLLCRPRADLHQRIAARTRAMLAGGAVAEVARIPHPAPTLARAIGFREIRSLLAGSIDLAACESLINAATRQYAKRQETWFRRERWLQPVPSQPEV